MPDAPHGPSTKQKSRARGSAGFVVTPRYLLGYGTLRKLGDPICSTLKSRILIIRTPKKGTLIFGKSHIQASPPTFLEDPSLLPSGEWAHGLLRSSLEVPSI